MSKQAMQSALDALAQMVESVAGVDQVSAVNEARAAIAELRAEIDAPEPEPQQPFGWYDPSEDKFSRDRDAHKRGATLWAVYRDAGVKP